MRTKINNYVIVLASNESGSAGAECFAECNTYISAYNSLGQFEEVYLQGFFLGLYFKTLEHALDNGLAKQVKSSDLISGKVSKQA